MDNKLNDVGAVADTTEQFETEEQLTVEVPVEIRAGTPYNCCKRHAE